MPENANDNGVVDLLMNANQKARLSATTAAAVNRAAWHLCDEDVGTF